MLKSKPARKVYKMSHLDPDLLRVGDVLLLPASKLFVPMADRKVTLLPPVDSDILHVDCIFMAKVDDVDRILPVSKDSFKIGWLSGAKLLVESEELDTTAVDVANLLKGL